MRRFFLENERIFCIFLPQERNVAQPGSALAWGARGRGFKSRRSDNGRKILHYFVYIIKSLKNGKYYIGQTRELSKRLYEHNHGKVKSTKAYRPYEMIHTEIFSTRRDARKRELHLKSPKGWQELQTIKKAVAGFPKGSLRDKSRLEETPFGAVPTKLPYIISQKTDKRSNKRCQSIQRHQSDINHRGR